VPEASIDEDGNALPREDHIRPDRPVTRNADWKIDAVAKPERKEGRPYGLLEPGVAPPIRLHDAAPLRRNPSPAPFTAQTCSARGRHSFRHA